MTTTTLDINKIREDFPILHQTLGKHHLVYLDNAATSQKPNAVISAITRYYEQDNANVHRGIYTLSERATKQFEAARHTVKQFIKAPDEREIIFVRGTTEAINLLAHSFAIPRLNPGDEILISAMEHHSNIVPWQLACEHTGAKLRIIPMNQQGELLMEQYCQLLTPRTKLVAVVHISNALGTVNPVEEMIALAHAKNIPVLIDGAQAAPHMPIDVTKLDCDFYAFSSHKVYGPTGIGVLYGKSHWLEEMIPYQGGGEMISQVSFEKTTYKEIPHKFEAGTPAIAEAIGLGAALNYLQALDRTAVQNYEDALLAYGTEALQRIHGLRLIGTAKRKASILSFVLEGAHAHDVSTIVNETGIAIRAGHHCAMPVMNFFNVPASSRVSFAFYNTREEIDALVEALQHVRGILR